MKYYLVAQILCLFCLQKIFANSNNFISSNSIEDYQVSSERYITDSGGKIFINPQMIIGKAPYEHVRYKKHFGKIIFYFKTDIIYLLEKNPLMKLILRNIRKIIRK